MNPTLKDCSLLHMRLYSDIPIWKNKETNKHTNKTTKNNNKKKGKRALPTKSIIILAAQMKCFQYFPTVAFENVHGEAVTYI